MPEYPDVTVYVERLAALTAGHALNGVRLGSPFLLRSVDPPLDAVKGRVVRGTRRIGKRVVIELEGTLFLVIHLMIAGRLSWKPAGAALRKKIDQAAFDFDAGTLVLTEAGTKRRASLHLVQGEAALAEFERGGVELFDVDAAGFAAAMRRENHTLKRALTDPRIVSGVGNAYSDEILHRAKLSPFKQTASISDADLARLFDAARAVLAEWTATIRAEAGDGLPPKVTAFREGMAVHGRHRQPCPVCGTPVQRIVYADNEANYCATCQTGGRLLADRALSQLLGKDWPKTVEELEERRRGS